MSLPRLELCGAALLVRLMNKVVEALKIEIEERHYWTDSKIVLAWIGAPSRRWQTFVANRVSEIQSSSSSGEWHHVKSRDNPADLISRGSTPMFLNESTLWWEGPPWLKTASQFRDAETLDVSLNCVPEQRRRVPVAIALVTATVVEFERFSSYPRLLRVLAYVLRFVNKLRKDESVYSASHISPAELERARNVIIASVQASTWIEDIQKLKGEREVKRSSKLISLRPYLDTEGLIRVGGRLDWSMLSTDAKHPLVIPSEHHLTRLINMDRHVRLFHAGLAATLAAVRCEFWPISGMSTVKRYLAKCVVCRKAQPKPYQQIMGQLPEARVQISRPFAKVGLDYCGPIFVRDRVRRNSKQYKAYVAIFVCMATKAVHIELVDDLTTEAFLGSLKRFEARRGLPSDICILGQR
ncbi:PREDICTED: uncharacterized protein LOC105555749 [Vollenhovia emeryi]|uniref:uncharacterized protein LOC105555749 n=1 Tax=Vollenhovia emeryi TaxID=411798 RepID=UPI0005F3D9BD|nr:PREDICTED: uncharacterized protein LOC105555749 [Vollenhovia emeryi]